MGLVFQQSFKCGTALIPRFHRVSAAPNLPPVTPSVSSRAWLASPAFQLSAFISFQYSLMCFEVSEASSRPVVSTHQATTMAIANDQESARQSDFRSDRFTVAGVLVLICNKLFVDIPIKIAIF